MTEPKAWGTPLARLDLVWTRIEARLAVWVILAEIATLVFWVSVTGLASFYSPDGNAIGLIYRSILAAIILGTIVHFATRKRGAKVNAIAVTASTILGLVLGRIWVHAGVSWASNLAAWLLNASVPMLIGGPRGIVTRLTL